MGTLADCIVFSNDCINCLASSCYYIQFSNDQWACVDALVQWKNVKQTLEGREYAKCKDVSTTTSSVSSDIQSSVPVDTTTENVNALHEATQNTEINILFAVCGLLFLMIVLLCFFIKFRINRLIVRMLLEIERLPATVVESAHEFLNRPHFGQRYNLPPRPSNSVHYTRPADGNDDSVSINVPSSQVATTSNPQTNPFIDDPNTSTSTEATELARITTEDESSPEVLRGDYYNSFGRLVKSRAQN